MANNKAITFKKTIGSISEESRRRILAQKTPDVKAVKEWEAVCNLFSDLEHKKLVIAYDFSRKINYKHEGLSSEIYFSHPLRVASIATILSGTRSIDYPILGLLHNIIEVSDISKAVLSFHFGDLIAEQIEILTVERTLQWDEAYKKDYYGKINNQPHCCRVVKIVDKFDNLFLLYTNPNKEIKKKYIKEIETYIQPMVSKDLPIMEDYFTKLVGHCKKQNY